MREGPAGFSEPSYFEHCCGAEVIRLPSWLERDIFATN